MAFDLWSAFVAASVALLLLPGPTVLLVLSYALTQGRRVAVASALAVAAGDLIAMTVSLVGLGALMAGSALAFAIVKWLGALYLLYLGLRMLLSARTAPEMQTPRTAEVTGPGQVFRHLMLVTALNPKGIGFFVAFVPQFIRPDVAFAPQAGILIATFVGLAALNALAYALAAGAMRDRIARPAIVQRLTWAGGATLIAMGAFTATLRRGTP
ncbi:MAG: LysE family translocator [Shimia sp.]